MRDTALAIILKELAKCESQLIQLRADFNALIGSQRSAAMTIIVINIATAEAQRDALTKIRDRLNLGGLL